MKLILFIAALTLATSCEDKNTTNIDLIRLTLNEVRAERNEIERLLTESRIMAQKIDDNFHLKYRNECRKRLGEKANYERCNCLKMEKFKGISIQKNYVNKECIDLMINTENSSPYGYRILPRHLIQEEYFP